MGKSVQLLGMERGHKGEWVLCADDMVTFNPEWSFIPIFNFTTLSQCPLLPLTWSGNAFQY
jgi:hypothetical protein